MKPGFISLAALACSAALMPFAALAMYKVIRIGVVMRFSGPASNFGVMGK
jgi:hypothetical protein